MRVIARHSIGMVGRVLQPGTEFHYPDGPELDGMVRSGAVETVGQALAALEISSTPVPMLIDPRGPREHRDDNPVPTPETRS